jgi:hypothetical protein
MNHLHLAAALSMAQAEADEPQRLQDILDESRRAATDQAEYLLYVCILLLIKIIGKSNIFDWRNLYGF